MSEHDEAVDMSEGKSSCCASCGALEDDDIKLIPCDGCDLVKYCGDECLHDHKLDHEEDCRKRAAELRDEILFKQPESSHLGDCPICSLPLSFDTKKYAMYYCCSKIICYGCCYANTIRDLEQRLVQSCPFCREPTPDNNEEADKLRMKRVEANDPVAMCRYGVEQYDQGDFDSAFHYYTKAAELGDAEAHHRLAYLYQEGRGVEQNEGKKIHHLEEAAIGGYPLVRYTLGCYEYDNGNVEREVKHWIIASTQGDDVAIKELLKAFKEGFVSKEDLAAALRAHKAAVDETKSPQRKAAEEYYRRIGVL